MRMTPAFVIRLTWSLRNDGHVETEHLLVAEIRNAGADGAGGRSAARLRCDPVSDQRDPLQQPGDERAASVPGVYRSGDQKSAVLRSRLRCDQDIRPQPTGTIREFRLLFSLRVRGGDSCLRRQARMDCFL